MRKKLNMATFITLVVLVMIISLIVKSMIRDKKQGKSIICGDDCKSCGGHCHSGLDQYRNDHNLKENML